MAGAHTAVQDDAHAHETSSLDITRKTNFHLFFQKATLCKAVITFFKAVLTLLIH